MNDRRPRHWQLGVAALVAAHAVGTVRAIGRSRARPREPTGALLAAPGDAWLVLTVDVVAARPLVEPLFRDGGRLATATRAAGLGSLSDACEFDPLPHLRELMVAVPEGGDRGEFGVAFSADLAMDELVACARKTIRARDGSPSTRPQGSFLVIGDERAPDQAHLAYHQGGPFRVGRGAWLEAMIEAAAALRPRVPAEHEALRSALAPPGGPPRALTVTALLPWASGRSSTTSPSGRARPAPSA
jgi:hypothetical protein